MRLRVEWSRPIPMRDGTRQGLIYAVDSNKLPGGAGIYVFGRRFGKGFEALYVGKAENVRRRVNGQLQNNLRLMLRLRNAKAGRRIVLAGQFVPKPGQRVEKSIVLIERALIRTFLSEGHDLANKQGVLIRRHEIASDGRHPKRFIPRLMYLERSKGA